MSGEAIPGPAWIPAFLAELHKSRRVAKATEAAGVVAGTVYAQKRRNQQFAEAWRAALSGQLAVAASDHEEADTTLQVAAAQNGGWKTSFLEHLAETSNITASAGAANIPLTTVYRLRSRDAAFAAKWRAALFEGYINLEMEVLGYLRNPEASYKMDVANALRLLAAHKDAVSQEQAVRSNISAADVRASIARKVEALRQQVLAERAAKQAEQDE